MIGGKTSGVTGGYLAVQLFPDSARPPVLWAEWMLTEYVIGVSWAPGVMPSGTRYWSYALHLGPVRFRITRSV